MTFPKPPRRGPKPRKPLRRRWGRSRRGRLPPGLERFRELEKVADELWRRIVHAKSELCQRCGMRRATDAHHLVSRRYRVCRWLIDVGAHICKGCHMLVTVDGEENRALAIKLVGAERWEQLNIAKNCGAKTDPLAAAVGLKYEASKRGVKL
jgi:hypothetical protein